MVSESTRDDRRRDLAQRLLKTQSLAAGATEINGPFTACFLELGAKPDTQLWIYSTLEDEPQDELERRSDLYVSQILRLVQELESIYDGYDGQGNAFGSAVLLGSVHTRIFDILDAKGLIDAKKAGTFQKWLFRSQDLPSSVQELPQGLSWGTATEDDCRAAIAGSTVPRPM